MNVCVVKTELLTLYRKIDICCIDAHRFYFLLICFLKNKKIIIIERMFKIFLQANIFKSYYINHA